MNLLFSRDMWNPSATLRGGICCNGEFLNTCNSTIETLSDQKHKIAYCCPFFPLEKARKAPAERRETDMRLKALFPLLRTKKK